MREANHGKRTSIVCEPAGQATVCVPVLTYRQQSWSPGHPRPSVHDPNNNLMATHVQGQEEESKPYIKQYGEQRLPKYL